MEHITDLNMPVIRPGISIAIHFNYLQMRITNKDMTCWISQLTSE